MLLQIVKARYNSVHRLRLTSMSVRPKGSTSAGLMKTPFKRQIRQSLTVSKFNVESRRQEVKVRQILNNSLGW